MRGVCGATCPGGRLPRRTGAPEAGAGGGRRAETEQVYQTRGTVRTITPVVRDASTMLPLA